MAYLFYNKDVTDMSIREINKLYREKEKYQQFPICGEFNATERAIRRLRKFLRGKDSTGGIEYASMLDAEISNVVNQCNQR
jgi:hypothetical protein